MGKVKKNDIFKDPNQDYRDGKISPEDQVVVMKSIEKTLQDQKECFELKNISMNDLRLRTTI